MVNAKAILILATAAAVFLGATCGLAQDPVDLLPAVEITGPEGLVNQAGPVALPSTITLTFNGSDPDGSSGQPVKFRFLFTTALLANDTYADTRLSVETFVMDLAAFSKEGWSDWQVWDSDPENRQITFENLSSEDIEGRLIYYLFVLQVMDEVSAVSVMRNYGVNLAHFFVSGKTAR